MKVWLFSRANNFSSRGFRISFLFVMLLCELTHLDAQVRGQMLHGRHHHHHSSDAFHGGQQPVVGAHIYLFAINTTGFQAAPISLLNGTGVSHDTSGNGYVVTDSNGNFNITGLYSCPTPTSSIYLQGVGGDPGSGSNNAYIKLVDVLPVACSQLSTISSATMNELTTVAAAWGLVAFSDPTDVTFGVQISNNMNVGYLQNAIIYANNMVNGYTGSVVPTYPAGTQSDHVAAINTMADILADCVDMDAPGTCSSLFTNASFSGGPNAGDTLQAAMNIAQNPGQNVANIFSLLTSDQPFTPVLSSAPSDWVIGNGTPTQTTVTIPDYAAPDNVSVPMTASVSCNSACGYVNYRVNGGEWNLYPLDSTGSVTIGFFSDTVSTNNTVQVYYLGNDTYQPSFSGVHFETVQPPTITTHTTIDAVAPFDPGTNVLVHAHVDCHSSCGYVNFLFDGAEWGTALLDNSGEFQAYRVIGLGPHTVEADFLGSGTYEPSTSGAIALSTDSSSATVQTTVTTSLGQAAVVPPNTNIWVSAQVGCNTACGNVDFTVDGTDFNTFALNNAGSSTVNMLGMSAGLHSVIVNYGGNPVYLPATSSPVNFTVSSSGVTPSTVVFASSSPTANYAALASFTATISPSAATGTVAFTDSGVVIGTASAVGGVATLTPPALAAGTHNVGAFYSGDSTYSPASSSASNQVILPTITGISLSQGPVQTIFVITGTGFGSDQSGANTYVSLNGSELTTLSWDAMNGITVQVPTGATTGNIVVTVNGSSSATLNPTFTVTKAVSTVLLSSSVSPSTVGSQITFTAALPQNATGNMSFLDGATTLGSAIVTNGIASLTTSSLAAGTHTITATYGGDATFYGSSSPAFSQIVNLPTPIISLATSGSPLNHGASVTFTTTFSNASAGALSGSVTYTDAGTVIGTGQISGTTATFTTSSLAAGSHVITASWSGNSNYTAAAPASLTQVINGIPILGPLIINTVAGNGTLGYSGDGGPATSASLQSVNSIAFDGANNLYFCDGNSRVREISAATGFITTVAGNGTNGNAGDSQVATSAEIFCSGMGVDAAGDIFIADIVHNRIRKVTASTGLISTVAGGGTVGYTGDGGQAVNAEIALAPVQNPSQPTHSSPFQFAVDGAGNLYFFNGYEYGNAGFYDIRVISASTGVISTYNNGQYGGSTSSNGPNFNFAIAPNGTFYFLESPGAADTSGNLYSVLGSDYLNWFNTNTRSNITLGPGAVYGEGCLQQTDSIGDGCLAFNAPSNSLTANPFTSSLAVDNNGNLYTGGGIYVRSIGAPLPSQTEPSSPSFSCNAATFGTNTLCSVSIDAAATGVVSLAYPATGTGAIAYTPEAPISSGAASFPLPTSTLFVGSYPIVLTYSGDGTYVPAVQTGTLSISKATPTVTWLGSLAPIPYGTPLTTQLNASSSVPGTFTYNTYAGAVLPVGSNTLTLTFVPTDTTDYVTPISTSETLQVTDALPAISWSSPASIQYGTALSSAQLNATANVAGTFVYSPPSGTILQSGLAQSLSVTFTPSTSNNNSSNQPISKTVLIDVNDDSPRITGILPNPSAPGQTITISGRNFGPAQGSSTVSINGVPASPSAWSDGSITLVIPTNASTGSVAVTVGSVQSNGFLLMLLPVACPTPP